MQYTIIEILKLSNCIDINLNKIIVDICITNLLIYLKHDILVMFNLEMIVLCPPQLRDIIAGFKGIKEL